MPADIQQRVAHTLDASLDGFMTSRLEPCLKELDSAITDSQTKVSTDTIHRIEGVETSTRELLLEQAATAQKSATDILLGLSRVFDAQLSREVILPYMEDLRRDVQEVKASASDAARADVLDSNMDLVNRQLGLLSLEVNDTSRSIQQTQNALKRKERRVRRSHAKLEEVNALLGSMAKVLDTVKLDGRRDLVRNPNRIGDGLGTAIQELIRAIWLVFHVLGICIREFMCVYVSNVSKLALRPLLTSVTEELSAQFCLHGGTVSSPHFCGSPFPRGCLNPSRMASPSRMLSEG